MAFSKPNYSKRPHLVSGIFLILIACALPGSVIGQKVRRPTGPQVDKPNANPPKRPTRRPRVRPSAGGAAWDDSYAFTDLGDVFFGKGKFNASEAAYNEALKIWSGNADAVYGLGLSKFFKGEDNEANSILNRLRGMDSSLAADFAEELKRLRSSP